MSFCNQQLRNNTNKTLERYLSKAQNATLMSKLRFHTARRLTKPYSVIIIFRKTNRKLEKRLSKHSLKPLYMQNSSILEILVNILTDL